MSQALSMDLRERIVATYNAGGVTYGQVAKQFRVSESVVGKLVRQQRKEGSLMPHHGGGRKRAVSGETEEALIRHLREHPDATLAERRDALGLKCAMKTVWLSIKRVGGRFKKSPAGLRARSSRRGPRAARLAGVPGAN